MSSNTINEYKNIYYELSNYPTRRKDIKKKKMWKVYILRLVIHQFFNTGSKRIVVRTKRKLREYFRVKLYFVARNKNGKWKRNDVAVFQCYIFIGMIRFR